VSRLRQGYYRPSPTSPDLWRWAQVSFDGIYVGATWARDMRNLMVASLLIFFGAWFALRSFGNAGLWGAFLAHYAARGGLQGLRYPSLLKASFGKS